MSREIMQQALDALDNHNGNYKLTVAECKAINKVCDNLRQALAQPEQRAAWQGNGGAGYNVGGTGVAKPEQEPVAWAVGRKVATCDEGFAEIWRRGAEIWRRGGEEVTPLYTAPPSKPWVGLTEDEVAQIEKTVLTRKQAIKMIEHHLKEKNA